MQGGTMKELHESYLSNKKYIDRLFKIKSFKQLKKIVVKYLR
jgi:hypothetical protein